MGNKDKLVHGTIANLIINHLTTHIDGSAFEHQHTFHIILSHQRNNEKYLDLNTVT